MQFILVSMPPENHRSVLPAWNLVETCWVIPPKCASFISKNIHTLVSLPCLVHHILETGEYIILFVHFLKFKNGGRHNGPSPSYS